MSMGTPKETTTKTEPWDGAKPYIEKYLAQADAAYSSGQPKLYEGNTIADQSDATKQAIAAQTALGTSGTVAANLNNAAQVGNSIATGAGIGTNGLDALKAGTTYSNPATSGLQGLATTLSGNSNPAAAYLQKTASGANIGNNPYLMANIASQQAGIADQLKNVINPQIDGQASQAGRLGSGAYASMRNTADATASKAMSDVAVKALTDQYNTDIAAQGDAAKAIGGMYDSNNQNAISAGSAASSAANGQQQIRNDAANSLAANDLSRANTQLGAAQGAGSLFQNQSLQSQLLGSVGQQQDSYNQNVLNSLIQKWDAQQNAPFVAASNMLNMANGGGYSNQTTPVYQNSLGQIAGLLSGIGGLAALCDGRAKFIIRHLGFMPILDGSTIPMYEFTYKSDPEQKIWVGPIAQEVEEVLPEAVIELGGVKHILTDTFVEAA